MTDSLLSSTDIEEELSRVYVQAVAALAGYVIDTPSYDRAGIDLTVKAGEPMYPAIELQLKATINLGAAKDGFFHYPLEVKNYKKLRKPSQTPRLLVVLDLPKDEASWLTVSGDELVLRRCAYWLSLRGCEETQNTSTITVCIPEQNLFNVDNLRRLMEQSRGGIVQ